MFLSSYTNTSGSLGKQEMLWEHEPQASVSTALLSSPKLSRVYNSIETRSTSFLFFFRKQHEEKKENNLLTLIIKM